MIDIDAVAALLVVDLQTLTLANARVVPAADLLQRTNELAEAFRARGLPVVIGTSTGTPAGRNAYGAGGRQWPAEALAAPPELSLADDDVRVSRSALSLFAGTDLETMLRANHVTQVVLVGLATSFGVESTARAAYDLGFNVVVVVDAVSDMRAETHENALANVFPVIGAVATTGEVLEALPPLR
ncbi:cysteine hydrolase family protein [Leifsonia sp. Leaf264]|uniref:cysteine hydrolase family protein n=1 Tax=Leifsonia sp. Leaf264 TaxID=1736314 RepID=UPI0006F4AEC0|nr:cysteine hydrolase [Leifsonia sp. Leaf264]KQO97472.1 hypothetical protein ASF30_13630 [Leifsonia sp. Leaf264]